MAFLLVFLNQLTKKANKKHQAHVNNLHIFFQNEKLL